ncbi:hypothetical protein TorRG33x02_279190 [Trema orientale]|uniref:Uncharacterized protein n=1 Tax=Trema orientale TaxID=63057 RepID=A0A2P5CN06_TREOI|nr:hypothetical protein TorRG33x02_279190 [Trema orientale]
MSDEIWPSNRDPREQQASGQTRSAVGLEVSSWLLGVFTVRFGRSEPQNIDQTACSVLIDPQTVQFETVDPNRPDRTYVSRCNLDGFRGLGLDQLVHSTSFNS